MVTLLCETNKPILAHKMLKLLPYNLLSIINNTNKNHYTNHHLLNWNNFYTIHEVVIDRYVKRPYFLVTVTVFFAQKMLFYMLCHIKKIGRFLKYLSQPMRLWYLSHRRPAKAQASLRIRAVSPEPSMFAHMKYGSRRRVRPKIRHLVPLDGCACAFEE